METIAEYLSALQKYKALSRQIVCHKTFAAEEARHALLRRPLSRGMQRILEAHGIVDLYSHQAEGIDAIRSGQDTVITTPTASGKSLVYTVPVLESFFQNPDSRAILIFPLKALAHDQAKMLEKMLSILPPEARPEIAVYDGDSSDAVRRKIRKNPPHILITNPDMLHLGIVPHHESWTTFLASLSHIVLDEAHIYRGVFGSHMAMLLRRLERICRRYNTKPTHILCTATIGNPLELTQNLLGVEKAHLVEHSGAAKGKRHFVLMNPEESPSSLAIDLIKSALKRKMRTIVYCKSRKMTELISIWASKQSNIYKNQISAYRAGFLPEERREIESRMASGNLLCVVSTSALELGIDIGNLDLCLLIGYPGTIMSTLQRGGRVGRKGQESAVFLLAGEDALDQYFMHKPEEFFQKPPEQAVLSIDNEVILEKHLECAASEIPLRPKSFDKSWFENPLTAEQTARSLEKLCAQGLLLESAEGGSYFASRKRPQRNVDLRGCGASFQIVERAPLDLSKVQNIDPKNFWADMLGDSESKQKQSEQVEEFEQSEQAKQANSQMTFVSESLNKTLKSLQSSDKDKIIGTVDLKQAYTETHEGAVYLHKGKTYLIDKTDFATKKIYAHLENVNWHTRVRSNKTTEILEEVSHRAIFGVNVAFGKLKVTEQITGFERRQNANLKLLDIQSLDLPPLVFETEGIWFIVPDSCREQLEERYVHFMGAIHAFEHIAIGLLPLIIMADRNDLGGISTPFHQDVASSAVFVYDGHAGGAGLCRKAFQNLETLLIAIEQSLASCPCETGCPSCVISPKCGSGNRPIDKVGAHELVKMFMQMPVGTHVPLGKKELEAQPEISINLGKSENALQAYAHFTESDIMVLDVETRYSAEEVGGWNKACNMGVSVAILWDGQNYKCFLQEELSEMFTLLKTAKLVVGFNTLGFDYKVLQPFADFDLWTLPSLDLLAEIKKNLNYRVSLENLGKSMFDLGKSADGLQALKWWKEGKIEEIAHYCQKDVELTKNVWQYGKDNGFVLFSNKAGQKARVKANWG